jgi:hypothetical protein
MIVYERIHKSYKHLHLLEFLYLANRPRVAKGFNVLAIVDKGKLKDRFIDTVFTSFDYFTLTVNKAV